MFLSVENIATLKSNKFISIEDFKRDYKVYPQRNDILMTRIGDVGTTNVVTDNDVKAYYVSLALLKYKETNPFFLSSAIQSDFVQKGLSNRTLKTAIPMKINKDEIGQVDVMLPTSADEQDKIGSFFSQLDTLITLHQRECAFIIIPQSDVNFNTRSALFHRKSKTFEYKIGSAIESFLSSPLSQSQIVHLSYKIHQIPGYIPDPIHLQFHITLACSYGSEQLYRPAYGINLPDTLSHRNIAAAVFLQIAQEVCEGQYRVVSVLQNIRYQVCFLIQYLHLSFGYDSVIGDVRVLAEQSKKVPRKQNISLPYSADNDLDVYRLSAQLNVINNYHIGSISELEVRIKKLKDEHEKYRTEVNELIDEHIELRNVLEQIKIYHELSAKGELTSKEEVQLLLAKQTMQRHEILTSADEIRLKNKVENLGKSELPK